MTPLYPDWNSFQDKIGDLGAKIASLTTELNNLKEQQRNLHDANQTEIHTIEERIEAVERLLNGDNINQGLITQMAVIIAQGKTSAFWMKALAALISLAIAGATLYAT